jgi:putative transposase
MPEPLHTVNERLLFNAARHDDVWSMTELCERMGISRQTGHAWERRYKEHGADGLKPRSHAPHTCPHRVEPKLAEVLLKARQAHPHWGPRKILPWLVGKHPELEGHLPAASTVGDLFKREGLVAPAKRRRPPVHRVAKLSPSREPNEIWAADYKGDFRTRDRRKCYPLTITDLYSRALLACDALLSVSIMEAMPMWERCFREHGLPERIRTDNGSPFAAATAMGLTRLNVWWAKLGILHERIDLGRPDQNGSHERMHRTLKAETTRPPGANQAAQQAIFDLWREEFVRERPHEALGQRTPASIYVRSPREMPERIPEPEYEGHCEIRRVRPIGTIKFQGQEIFLSSTLAAETIGLEEVDDGIWAVYFYDRLIGKLDQRTARVSPADAGLPAA